MRLGSPLLCAFQFSTTDGALAFLDLAAQELRNTLTIRVISIFESNACPLRTRAEIIRAFAEGANR